MNAGDAPSMCHIDRPTWCALKNYL